MERCLSGIGRYMNAVNSPQNPEFFRSASRRPALVVPPRLESSGCRKSRGSAARSGYDHPVHRKAFLAWSAATLPLGWAERPARGASPSPTMLDMIVFEREGDRNLARRALVLAPKQQRRHRALLVLLHGV